MQYTANKVIVTSRMVDGTSIDEQPQIASSRLEVGHWEGDTVVGKRNGREAVILTLLEKKTQHYLATRIPGKTSEAVNAAMQKLREDFGASFFSQIFKTITVDNLPPCRGRVRQASMLT